MNHSILITGASEGLGSALALQLAKRNFPLVLVARSVEKLHKLKQDFLEAGAPEVLVYSFDLSDPQAVDALIKSLDSLSIEGLVNNAGAGLVGPFERTDLSRERAMVELMVQTPLRLTKWLLNRSPVRGRVLNVASSGAYQPGTYTSVYYASKAFLSSWSQALSQETRGTQFQVSTLYPGALTTAFAVKAGKELSPGARDAHWVAERAVKGWIAGRKRIVPGWDNWLLIALSRLLPEWFTAGLVGKIQTSGKN